MRVPRRENGGSRRCRARQAKLHAAISVVCCLVLVLDLSHHVAAFSPPLQQTTSGGVKRHERPQRLLFATTDDDGSSAASVPQQQPTTSSAQNSTANGTPFPPVINGVAQSSSSTTTTTTTAAPSEPATTTTTTTTSSNGNGNTELGSSVLAIDPTEVDIVTLRNNKVVALQHSEPAELIRNLPFVSMFRGSANYIANHRNTLAVYHIPGGLLDLPNPNVFRDLMNDVALTWLLGMKIVLVASCRYQIEKRLKETHHEESAPRVAGLRVTDSETLRMVKEEAGFVRFEVERQLARSLRLQGGEETNTKAAKERGPGVKKNQGFYDGNVVSGNFYSARPVGILDGVDYRYTGFVRRVETDKIRRLHESRDICLLTTLGVSPSGEVFNVNSESLAASVAGALKASKIVYFTEKEMELRSHVHGNKIPHLRLSDARALLKHRDLTIHRKGFSTAGPGLGDNVDAGSLEMLHKIGWSIQALEQGVKRAHIISPKHGALLQELYTRDGSGTLISGDLYDGIRQARVDDVSGIHDLIAPLIRAGTLVDRPKSKLEQDIETYHVYTRDNLIVACGQLKQFENGFAEIGCLVVHPDYRSGGRGDAMLGYLERMCVMHGCANIFVLSTQTMEWFVERRFEEVGVDRLPPSRQKTYNYDRKSKIYMKAIESLRDLDASELWWNRS